MGSVTRDCTGRRVVATECVRCGDVPTGVMVSEELYREYPLCDGCCIVAFMMRNPEEFKDWISSGREYGAR